MKRISILGSTGSIGVNALEVISAHPEEFEVVALACREHAGLLAEQAKRFHPHYVGIVDESQVAHLKEKLDSRVEILVGQKEIELLGGLRESDLVLIAIGGAEALPPTLEAIRKGKRVAIANKESLVMAGDLLIQEAKKSGAFLLPVDSEHNAIFQCLEGKDRTLLQRIYLTGSGGPLRKRSKESFGSLTQEEVLEHPKWKMGRKITVDSATLMNKGLEVIEARHLFHLAVDQIEVLIHPEAVIHSMVEFVDGSVLAQLAVTDMKLPIQYALSYPDRLPGSVPSLNFKEVGALHFENPDVDKFPCLRIAYEVAHEGGSTPCALNAANEEAVRAYLSGGLPFVKIPALIEKVLSKHKNMNAPTLEEILADDQWAREEAHRLLKTI
ncbi:MAG: 1-deoxy-D-xylulose-5-phosphate reductoisomerase [Candidatus Omnitrophica bacterium]|nr:1-deoxy-D-xylulose-5-phosphate reductoisomerase [Candidatus Omnitrophota bacterium]